MILSRTQEDHGPHLQGRVEWTAVDRSHEQAYGVVLAGTANQLLTPQRGLTSKAWADGGIGGAMPGLLGWALLPLFAASRDWLQSTMETECLLA
jgi:hypothetical protein